MFNGAAMVKELKHVAFVGLGPGDSCRGPRLRRSMRGDSSNCSLKVGFVVSALTTSEGPINPRSDFTGTMVLYLGLVEARIWFAAPERGDMGNTAHEWNARDV